MSLRLDNYSSLSSQLLFSCIWTFEADTIEILGRVLSLIITIVSVAYSEPIQNLFNHISSVQDSINAGYMNSTIHVNQGTQLLNTLFHVSMPSVGKFPSTSPSDSSKERNAQCPNEWRACITPGHCKGLKKQAGCAAVKMPSQ